ncbi:MAG: ribokinase [Fimbriimonadales bacterium]|nr:ribokinase [Fimbriimonadales bacterium]
MSRIVVVGSANIDFVFRVVRSPNAGETLSGDGWAVHPGGKGANQAVAAAKLGGDVLFVAKAGTDPQTEAMLESYRAAGLRTHGILRTNTVPTGAASIWVDASGQNRIIVVAGANGELRADEVLAAAAGFRGAAYALFQHETPRETVEESIRQIPEEVRVVLNPAPARHVSPEALARLWLVTPNESEAESITGVRPSDEASCATASAWFFERGVANVVITLGEKGCWVQSRGEQGAVVPAPTVPVVDTTAAGDAFNGALAVFLDEGLPLRTAARRANCAAALSVTKPGAQPSLPSRADLERFLSELEPRWTERN